MMIHSLYHHPYKGYISAMCFSSSIALQLGHFFLKFVFFYPQKGTQRRRAFYKRKRRVGRPLRRTAEAEPSSGGLVFSCVVTAIRRRRIKINVSVCASFCAGSACRLCKKPNRRRKLPKKEKKRKERKQKVARSYRSKNGERGNTVKKQKLLKIK